jgi:hypothetical protein
LSVNPIVFGVNIIMDDNIEKEIVDKYTNSRYSLRHLAENYDTNHHKIKRILIKHGVEITRRNTLKNFTDEHKRKISESRKKLKESGWTPYNKGLRTADRLNGKLLLYKNMLSHLRFDVELDWLMKFDDFEKLKCLNRAITNREDRFSVDSEWYTAYIEKFYDEKQFNAIYQKWKDNMVDRYLKPTLDHIVPKSKGGDNNLENLQFLTWFENRAKNNLSQLEWDNIKRNIKNYLI